MKKVEALEMASDSKPLITKLSIVATVGGAAAALVYYSLSRRKPVRLDKETFMKNKNIKVVNSKKEWETFRPQLERQLKPWPVLGMDCEWVSRKPVALLQLAAPHGLCLLIRQSVLADAPASLSELLADGSILKVGKAVDQDAKKLMRDHGILVNGCLDLTDMILYPPEGVEMPEMERMGLAALAQEFVGLTLNKGKSVRLSNWEARTLSDAQIRYAAMDAIASLLVFAEVSRVQVQSSNWTDIYNSYEQLLNPHSSQKPGRRATSRGDSTSDTGQTEKRRLGNTDSAKTRQHRMIQKRKFHASAHPLRKTPLYYNCELRAPDDQILCMCSPGKAKWFLDRGIAEQLSEDPLIVRLAFEPKGRPELDNVYYTQLKDNICVVCGREESYLKKKIIPHEYRRYFPAIMKDHQSHDVLLLCPGCHTKCERSSLKFRKQLAVECEAPLLTKGKGKTDMKLPRVKSAARALQRAQNIPDARIETLKNQLKKYLGKEDLTQEDIDAVVALKDPQRTSDGNHALGVVQHYAKKYGLVKLARMWRRNFVLCMQPKFLPEQWSVDHNHERMKLDLERLQGTEEPKWDYVIALEGLDTVNPNLYLTAEGSVREKNEKGQERHVSDQIDKNYRADVQGDNKYFHPVWKGEGWKGDNMDGDEGWIDDNNDDEGWKDDKDGDEGWKDDNEDGDKGWKRDNKNYVRDWVDDNKNFEDLQRTISNDFDDCDKDEILPS